MRYDLALFDFDGTLCDSSEGIVLGMALTFASFGLAAPSSEAVRRVIGLRIEECFQTLAPGLDPAALPQWIEAYRGHYHSQGQLLNRLFPGAWEMLREVRDAGLAVGIVSNKGQHGLEYALDSLGLARLCDLVAGARSGGPRKPDPAFYEAFVAPAYPRVPRQRVVLLGDTATDLLFARNLGLDASFAAWGYGDRQACLALEPRYVAEGPGAVAAAWK